MILADTPELAWEGDRLALEGSVLEALADRHGTPLYVYSAHAIGRRLRSYRQALGDRDALLCYAVKANSSLAVLQFFAERGVGFDIVSAGELERALAAGGDPARIVFSGVGKTRREMAFALGRGVRLFNVESTAELEALSATAVETGATARASLRVNPDVDAGTHPYISTGLRNNKFGVAHGDARAAYRRLSGLPGLAVGGIACHIGSQITDLAPYLAALDRLLDLVEQIEAGDGIAIDHVDIGGGLGIAYGDEPAPEPAALVQAVTARLDARGHGHRRLVLEPGRSLVGNAGVLVTEVVYLKPGAAKSFCIVDAAMNDLLRPTLYDAWMRIVECRRRPDVASSVMDVVGPVCESGDWLGRDRALAVRPGDRLAILSAGAYAMSMAGNYNSRPRPAEVWVEGGEAHLVRERETIADLMRGERLLPRRPR